MRYEPRTPWPVREFGAARRWTQQYGARLRRRSLSRRASTEARALYQGRGGRREIRARPLRGGAGVG